jgi:Spy/CpxP family protein refolding chaperone
MSLNLLDRPAVRSVWLSPKSAGLCILALVFLSGVVAGAVAMNLGVHKSLHASPFWKDGARAEYLKTIQKELDLTPEQTTQMATILDDFAKYYQTVLSDGKARIYNILNDEQKRKFDRLLERKR